MAKLLQFTVANYRSFNFERTFTFVPTSIQDEPKESVASIWKYRFSTVSVVYGANSSGKSNLIDAIAMMSYIVRHSVKLNDNEELAYDPFMLSSVNESGKPTHFEIVYLDNNRKKFDMVLKIIPHALLKNGYLFSLVQKSKSCLYERMTESRLTRTYFQRV